MLGVGEGMTDRGGYGAVSDVCCAVRGACIEPHTPFGLSGATDGVCDENLPVRYETSVGVTGERPPLTVLARDEGRGSWAFA